MKANRSRSAGMRLIYPSAGTIISIPKSDCGLTAIETLSAPASRCPAENQHQDQPQNLDPGNDPQDLRIP